MKRTLQLLLAAALLLSLAACAQAPVAANADETPDWQTQYDLGVRYLSEGWAISAEEDGYVEVIRCLADGARSLDNGADGTSLNHDFFQAERRIQTDDSLDWVTAMGAGPNF